MVVAAFTALVWLDSAAFFIMQHARDLRSATWGEPMLWRNAVVHLSFAIAAGLLLRRRFSAVLAAAWAILAVAALTVNHPATRGLAGWWYPAGVSLYSTALVAWPGFFTPDPDPRAIARRAAWLFAVAGWFGSANGIGMVQSLQRVPEAFIAAAGGVVLGVRFFGRPRWPAAAALAWTPSPAAAIPDGAPIYHRHCAICHGPVGHGDGKLAPLLAKAPAQLDRGPFIWTPAGPDFETRAARVIKHGTPGSDMPGHEMLDDVLVLALAGYVRYLREE